MSTDPDPAADPIIFALFAVLFLLFTVILSVGREAFPAIGDARLRELEEQGNRKAARVSRMIENESRFYGRVNAGMMLGGALIALNVVPLTVLWLSPVFGTVPYAAYAISFLTALAVAFVTVAFGCRLPGRLVRKNPSAALSVYPFFSLLYKALFPFDALGNGVIYPLLRLCGINPHEMTDQVTEEDIRELIDAGEELGTIEETQKDMVNNIFAFDDTTAAEIMTPRTDVTAVEVNDSVAQALQSGLDGGYSRIPVYEDDIDHILGILYIKDLLPYVGQTLPQTVTVRNLLRETHFVPDSKKCDDLFEEMNEKHLQMAIVVDEYGGVAGIVTMEDLLESIVGNMQDEFDNEEEEVTRIDDHSFVVDGSLNIGELADLLEMELPDGDYDTVAGFIMEQLGHIPETDEKAAITYENVIFTIRRMDDRRIEQVHIKVDALPTEETNKRQTET